MSSAPSSFLNDIYGLAAVEPPRKKDVVFGRGGFVNRNPGNREYLKFIEQYEKEYVQCRHKKFQKVLAVTILHYLRLQGVRFMKKDPKSNAWCTVKLSMCRQKISQRLRERAPFIKQIKAKEEGKTIVGDSSSSSSSSSLPLEKTETTKKISDKFSKFIPPLIALSKNGSPVFLSALARSQDTIAQVSASSSDEGDDDSTVSADEPMYCAPVMGPHKVSLAMPYQEVFNIRFYPVGEEDNNASPAKSKRMAEDPTAETDICRFCPCKRRRTSYVVDKDDTSLDGLSGLGEFQLDALLDDGVGLDDYLQL